MLPIRDYNPSRTTPLVTYALVGLNVLVFLYQLGLSERAGLLFLYRYGLVPAELVGLRDLGLPRLLPEPFSLITSLFVHGGFIHLAGNMLYLWIFGDNVEDTLGHGVFLVFYLVSGVVASLAYVFVNAGSTTPLVGASGAIAGVLGAYIILFPQARIQVILFFFFIIYPIWVPAVLVLGLWFLFQLLSLPSGGQVAVLAHVGGFIFGVLWVKFLPTKRPPLRRRPPARFFR